MSHGRPWRQAILLLMLAMPCAAAAELRFQEGVARNPDSGAVLYSEQHWLRSDGEHPVERLVLYRCPGGTAFGRKLVDYRQSAAAPAFRYEDMRSGYVEGLVRERGPRVFFRADRGSTEKSAALSAPQLVVDAGFDEFVRDHWSALLADQSVALDFALPSRLDSMAFTVRRIGATHVDNEPAWIFRLKLDGVLGWLAPHIDVSYGQQSRRLLRFEGLSNLRDDAGRKQLSARIDFPQPLRPATDSDWQAAAAVPLAACAIGH